MTLAEIIVAMFVLGILVPPLFQAYYQSQALTQRQINQEIAIKVAEGLLNQAQAVDFRLLASPTANASLPFQLELPGSTLKTSLPLAGRPANGSVGFRTGPTPFRIEFRTEKAFVPPGPGQPPPLFTYANPLGRVATYPCPDNFLILEAKVEFFSGAQSHTITLRSARPQ